MRYAGGKALIARHIVPRLLELGHDRTTYIEPFVGGANIFCHTAQHFETAIGADASLDLILMWQALQQGWQPPDDVSPEEHARQRLAEPSALRGYVGFGCSFRGVWFGGYADVTQRRAVRKAVLDEIQTMRHARFVHADYRSLRQVSDKCLIYCDPPYYATSGYSAGARHFDGAEFWNHARTWVAQGALVAVSEYHGPADAEVIWSGEKAVTLAAHEKGGATARRTAIDKLFLLRPES